MKMLLPKRTAAQIFLGLPLALLACSASPAEAACAGPGQTWAAPLAQTGAQVASTLSNATDGGNPYSRPLIHLPYDQDVVVTATGIMMVTEKDPVVPFRGNGRPSLDGL
jgi:hypothetical protein